MNAFREALDNCGLIDLHFNRSRYTWCNNRDPPYTTWVRLDRGVANIEWLTRYHAAQVEHVDVTNSDHKCLCMYWERPPPKRHRKPFRFEEIWLEDTGCEETVQESWDPDLRGTAMFKVATKLKQCKKSLGNWSRQSFGSIKRQLANKKRQLEDAENMAMAGGSLKAVKNLRMEIKMLLKKEEKMWHQRSRSTWLKEGDRNTKYFHGRASQHRRRNTIKGIRDSAGHW